MTPEVILTIGLQASGKSTFCRANFAQTHTYISRDQFPKSVKNPSARQRSLLEEALSQHQSVVIDNTNITKEMRAEIISLAKQYQARCVGYYFASIARDCVTRNSLRTGTARVPDVAIFATLKKLEKPSLKEGFDQLFYVSLIEGKGFQIEPWQA